MPRDRRAARDGARDGARQAAAAWLDGDERAVRVPRHERVAGLAPGFAAVADQYEEASAVAVAIVVTHDEDHRLDGPDPVSLSHRARVVGEQAAA
ncbi:hypothetical protein [Trebonia sp.]|uniref:hypothetical protein n=1 Tax=Trebonia sp. TaxID=2767075 RepID=UPI002608CC08|nr:hypothetical protein [Trebonia sp.]